MAATDQKAVQVFSIRLSCAVRSCTNLAKASPRSGMFKAESAYCNASSLISRFDLTCNAPADKLLRLRLVITLGMPSGSMLYRSCSRLRSNQTRIASLLPWHSGRCSAARSNAARCFSSSACLTAGLAV